MFTAGGRFAGEKATLRAEKEFAESLGLKVEEIRGLPRERIFEKVIEKVAAGPKKEVPKKPEPKPVEKKKLTPRERFKKMADDLEEGVGFVEVLEKDVALSADMRIRLVTGFETGCMERATFNAATALGQKLEQDMMRWISWVEPISVGIVVAIVGGVVFSVMLPLITLLQQVG